MTSFLFGIIVCLVLFVSFWVERLIESSILLVVGIKSSLFETTIEKPNVECLENIVSINTWTLKTNEDNTTLWTAILKWGEHIKMHTITTLRGAASFGRSL